MRKARASRSGSDETSRSSTRTVPSWGCRIAAGPCGSIIPATAQSPLAKATGLRGFVYVEPFEIRKEFVLPLRDLLETLDLSPETKLDAAAREKLLASLRGRLAAACPIRADGALLAFDFDRIQFVSIDPQSGVTPDTRETVSVSGATVAAVFVITRDAPPTRLEITWDFFPDNKSEVSVGLEASAGTSMEFYNNTLTFTPNNPTQTWDLSDLGAAPALLAVSAPPRESRFPFYALGLGFLLIGILLLIRSRGYVVSTRKFARRVAMALLVLAAIALSASPPAHPKPLTDEEARTVVDTLLRNIYHAFAFRDESRIFDTLAASVSGDLLEEIYLDIRRDLELENAGGPRVKIHNVQLEECAPDTSTPPGFRAEARWIAKGNVSHWGHIHPRRNKYHGILTIEPIDDRWKVTGVEILEEERL